jgi:hypothetical protein
VRDRQSARLVAGGVDLHLGRFQHVALACPGEAFDANDAVAGGEHQDGSLPRSNRQLLPRCSVSRALDVEQRRDGVAPGALEAKGSRVPLDTTAVV